MEDTIVQFSTAKLIKEKGFNVFCNFIYPLINFISYEEDCGKEFKEGILYKYTFLNKEEVIFAPTLSLAQKWLREVHNIDIMILGTKGFYYIGIYKKYFHNLPKYFYPKTPIKWEESLELGIIEALKLIK